MEFAMAVALRERHWVLWWGHGSPCFAACVVSIQAWFLASSKSPRLHHAIVHGRWLSYLSHEPVRLRYFKQNLWLLFFKGKMISGFPVFFPPFFFTVVTYKFGTFSVRSPTQICSQNIQKGSISTHKTAWAPQLDAPRIWRSLSRYWTRNQHKRITKRMKGGTLANRERSSMTQHLVA